METNEDVEIYKEELQVFKKHLSCYDMKKYWPKYKSKCKQLREKIRSLNGH